MRIVIDGRMYGTEYRGVGRYVQNLVENLQKVDEKNEYTLLLRKKYFDSLRLRNNWQKVEADFSHYGLSEQAKLPRILKSIRHDLVHFPHFNVPLFYRGKFVVTIHDLIMHKGSGKKATTRARHLYLAKRFGYKKVFSHAINDSKKIITPSKYAKQDIVKNYKMAPEKVEVIYEGFDPMIHFGQNLTSDKFKNLSGQKYFLYAGNAYPHKNVKRLIEAIRYLNNDLEEPIKLVLVVGNNHFSKKLSDFAEEIDAQNVMFFDYVSDDELGWLYKNAISFVYPSLEEGFGLQGLESMANQTLLASSDIPVFKEIYKNAAIYFNPYDFSSIQKTLFDILNMKKSKRDEYISEGKKVVKLYSLEKMAKETLKVYEGSV